MLYNRFFTTNRINDYTTMIIGVAGENCVLFTGRDKALLFDSLSGAGSLKAFVREMTDLPIIPVLSHAHPDHEGGFFEYGECCVHPDDMDLFYSDYASGVEGRLNFVNTRAPYAPPHRLKVRMEDMVAPCAVKLSPVYNGDVFDLGGVQLEVIHVPGHTKGTIALLDREAELLYSADAINGNTLLHLEGSATVEEYRNAVEHLKTYQDAFTHTYTSHSALPVPASIVDDALMVCDKILAREDDAVQEEGHLRAMAVYGNCRPVYGGESNICYLEDRIFGKSQVYRRWV